MDAWIQKIKWMDRLLDGQSEANGQSNIHKDKQKNG